MVQVNVDTIAAVNPKELSAQEKDDMYENIMWLEADHDIPPDKYQPLFNVTIEVLKYKGEQVESLLADLDILAASAGGDNEQTLEELSKNKRLIEELNEEILAKEKELENEKLHSEKLLQDIAELQKEKTELRREIVMMQTESQPGLTGSLHDDDSSDDTHQLKEMMQTKNKHILQLLSDIQFMEKEIETLNKKLTSMRQELSEATSNLTKLSGENISLRQANYDFQEKISTLEERTAGLTSQVSELVEEKCRREKNLDRLIDALEERVSKWQEILSQKDDEVTELRAKLNESMLSSGRKGGEQFTTNYTELTQTIEEQEAAIKRLHDQLKQATEDMERSSFQVQELKQRVESKEPIQNDLKKMEELKEELDKAQSQITYLQDKLNDAEQDAQFRAEEMTELIIQLREYEEGVYGLTEARNQVKELKKQLKVRDNQILKLIEQINALNLQMGGENTHLSQDRLKEIYLENDDLTSNLDLQTQLSAIQQTAINLSMQNFDMRAQILKLKEELKGKEDMNPVSDDTENKEIEDQLHSVIEENEALRKGLHEVLESIQNHDGTSRVVIESACLDKLLDALDSRHMAGWYHPGMRLQAALNKMQGTNDTLRQELRESRFRESYFQAELQTAMIQIGEMEDKLRKFEVPEYQPPTPAPRTQVDSRKKVETSDEPVKEEKEVERTGHESPKSVIPAGDDILKVSPKSRKSSGHLSSSDEKINRTYSIEEEDVGIGGQSPLVEELPVDEADRKAEDVEPGVMARRRSGEKGRYVDQVSQTDRAPMVEVQVQTVASPPPLDTSDVEDQPVKDLSGRRDSLSSLKNGTLQEGKTGYFENGKPFKQEAGDLREIENGRKVLSPSKLPIFDEIENKFRKKCDELRVDVENIKKINETALKELHESKEELFREVQNSMDKVKEEINILKETSTAKVASAMNEFTLGAFKEQETKLLSYGIELGELRKGISEKDNLISSLENVIKELKGKLEDMSSQYRTQQEKKLKALKETINSLQQIITQKESAIERYKAMLQENSDEYGQLLDKYHKLESNVSKVVSPRDPLTDAKSVSILMAKWIARVHGLEAEINDLQRQIIEANHRLEESNKEAEHWKELTNSIQQNLTSNEELQQKCAEIEEMKITIKNIKSEAEMGFENTLKEESMKYKKREEELNFQIKSMESEISKLKHQLSIRSSKSTSKSAKREHLLLDRIKNLEDELEKSRARERYQLQMRRDKCTDEVAKWEEKKRLQTNNEKYKNELKDKAAQIELLETQASRLKVIIARMERERISLQRRLKLKDGLLAKSMSEDSREQDYEDHKSFGSESHLGDTPVPDMTPRSQTESPNSDLHDPKVKAQSRRDLVRAIASLKKVISKLRAEHSNYYHKDYVLQLQNELRKMETNYMDAVERTLSLEEQLRAAETKICRETFTVGGPDDRTELIFLKEQLAQKCELLGKVKILLQRAILREKQLIQQVTFLEQLVPPDKLAHLHWEAREH